MAHPGGRPANFSTPEELFNVFTKWKQEFLPGGELQHEIPDVEGFCDYTDSYRNLLNEYEKKEEFTGTIKRIKNWIYYRKKQLAMKNEMNATVFIFDSKNNAGYVDKTEVDNNVNLGLDISAEQADQLIRARAKRRNT